VLRASGKILEHFEAEVVDRFVQTLGCERTDDRLSTSRREALHGLYDAAVVIGERVGGNQVVEHDLAAGGCGGRDRPQGRQRRGLGKVRCRAEPGIEGGTRAAVAGQRERSTEVILLEVDRNELQIPWCLEAQSGEAIALCCLRGRMIELEDA
jgi:hypothetical protein